MPQLHEVIASALREHLPAARPIDIDGVRRVRAVVAQNAHARYIAYRCREYVRTELGREDSPAHSVEAAEARALTQAIASDTARNFPRIEDAFGRAVISDDGRIELSPVIDALKNASQRHHYRSHALKMRTPRRNRSEFVWSILWGLVANDIRWLDHESDLFAHIERRLRKIERMRYFVSIAASVRTRSIDAQGRDGHVLRMFEYPTTGYPRKLGGRGDEHWTGAVVGILKNFPPGSSVEAIGANSPVDAITALFQEPDEPHGWGSVIGRHFNYCDTTLQMLHLEEVAAHLEATNTDPNQRALQLIEEAASPSADANTKATQRRFRFSIRSSWQVPGSSQSTIGTGVSPDQALNRVGDPFFEFSEDVRIDQLVPGDHIVVRSHPAFYGVSTSAWRLENFLVTGFSDKRVGRQVPNGLELQGHGAGPWMLPQAQRKLVNMRAGLGGGINRAQRLTEQHLAAALSAHDDPPLKAPYIIDREDGFGGALEFRNEFRPRGIAAFWTRWVTPWDEVEHAEWVKSLSQSENEREWTEYSLHNSVTFAPRWNLPYVSGVTVDAGARKVTLGGHNLTPDVITGVYLVSHPRRVYALGLKAEPGRGFSPDVPGETMLSVLGQWDADQSPRSVLREGSGLAFVSGGIEVQLPSTFNPVPAYWRAVVVTNIRMHVRAQLAFRWGVDSQPSVIGTGSFNVGYFPLWETGSGSRTRPVRVQLTRALTRKLLDYYDRGSPHGMVRVIRPRKPEW